MPSAYPMLARCARHQCREDAALFRHLLDREREERILRPNLYVLTGPRQAPEGEYGTMVAMLVMKAG
jgi:hypothetical protein